MSIQLITRMSLKAQRGFLFFVDYFTIYTESYKSHLLQVPIFWGHYRLTIRPMNIYVLHKCSQKSFRENERWNKLKSRLRNPPLENDGAGDIAVPNIVRPG